MKKTINLSNHDDPVLLSCVDAFSDGDFSVDAEKGLFKNIAIITKGMALGHGFEIDDETLTQVETSVNSDKLGIKSRLTHPEGGSFFGPSTDAIEVMLGRVRNARIEGNKVKGDLQLGKYSKMSPKGDLWGYLTAMAEEDPQAAGLSISFYPGKHEEREDKDGNSLPPACRVKQVVGVDFVGNPAANPSGFLARGDSNLRKDTLMNKKLRKYLIQLGLAVDATDAQAIEYWHALEGKHKWVADALAEVDADASDTDADADADADAVNQSAVEKAVLLADQKRRTAIEALAEKHKLSTDWARGLCDRGVSLAQATELVKLADTMQPIKVGVDRDKATLSDGIEDAILLRTGFVLRELDKETGIAVKRDDGQLAIRKPHDRASQFRGLSLERIGRCFLASLGVPGVEYMSKSQLADLLFNPLRLQAQHGIAALAQGTSDFPYILANVMRKTLLGAYNEAETDWPKFCAKNTEVDYKQFSLVALSEAPDLVQRYEGEGIDYGALSERREVATLAEYDKGLRFTRKMFINDDLSAFGRTPRMLGMAAKRLEDDLAFAMLTGGVATETMSDGNFLFDAANHANYVTTGGAPSVTTLNTAEAMMGIQRGMAGLSYLNITPKTILIPKALNGVTKQLLASTVVPGATEGHSLNVWAGRLDIIANARLDTYNPAGWFLAGDPNMYDTIMMTFLESEQTPVVKQEVEFDTEDLKFAIRHSAVAKAVDWKALFYNDGA